MNSISQKEKKRVAALFLTPFLVLTLMFGVHAVVSHFKTQDLIKWIGFTNDEWAQQALVEGANPNARTADGWSMVMWAVGNDGNIAIVKMLKSAGAETNATEDLFIAALDNDEDEARSALKRGADINAVEKDNWTPLMWATRRLHPKIIKMLLDAGADINRKGKDGETASDLLVWDASEFPLDGSCRQNALKNNPCKLPPECLQTLRLLQNATKIHNKN